MKHKILFLVAMILSILASVQAEIETDSLYCMLKLTPFEGGEYYGEYNAYQLETGGDLNGDGYS
ncbi:MAG: hypothetical protein JXR48_15055, partial [Candidatus Delongbacteria bacterium]|nr:hypothetical protein [Candidatus Delongbacteria bacterium]MBN2836275.1 hypothetical protein [Candidatus Delongbacteria bacterium]